MRRNSPSVRGSRSAARRSSSAPAFPRALDWAATVALADEALYAVKRGGRNGWEGVIGVPPRGDVPDLEGALRRHSRESMADWLASGDLTVVRSSPPAEPDAAPARTHDAGKS